MSLITILAVAIVLAGAMLVVAAGFTLGAEKAPADARDQAAAVPVRLWCPAVGEVTRVGIAPAAYGSGLAVAWCERFPAGPIDCDRACLPQRAAA